MYDGRGVKGLRIGPGTYLELKGPLHDVLPTAPMQKAPPLCAAQNNGNRLQQQLLGFGALEGGRDHANQKGTESAIAVTWTSTQILKQGNQTL